MCSSELRTKAIEEAWANAGGWKKLSEDEGTKIALEAEMEEFRKGVPTGWWDWFLLWSG